jgi:hypothetical protein
MPCLNEQDGLLATCRSLGFDRFREPPERCFLVLVDNGSTDRTPTVCRALQSEVGAVVVVVSEPERGYVPARHRGNLAAAHIARTLGIPPETFVVIQADADAIYSPDYVNTVRNAISHGTAEGRIGHAIIARIPGLDLRYPRVFSAVDAADQAIQQRFGAPEPDALVDDKACAYTLGDYERWGGHRREYLADGSELLAETTRLTIAGLAHGAGRVEIVEASVVHSQRRLLTDAALHLAAAGFPYANRRIVSDRTAVRLDDLERMVASGEREVLDEIVTTRIAHLAALTVVLPAHLVRTLTGQLPEDPSTRAALNDLPHRTVHDASTTPGRLLGDVLELAWDPSALLARLNLP